MLVFLKLFRHGERNASTDLGLTYPTDPYKNFSVFPEGKADLTKVSVILLYLELNQKN